LVVSNSGFFVNKYMIFDFFKKLLNKEKINSSKIKEFNKNFDFKESKNNEKIPVIKQLKK